MGKTREAIYWLLEDKERYLLVHSRQEQLRVCDLIRPGVDDESTAMDRVLTFEEALHRGILMGKRIKEIGIDNVDHFIQRFFHAPVTFGTYTEPEQKP